MGTGLVSGASGLLGGGRTHEQTSLSQSAIGSNITVDAGSVSGSYSRDPGSANGHLANAFDPTALSNALQAQQLGGQLVGEVGGQVSDVLKSSNPAFAEGGAGRVGLETAGNAIVAAVTGGNVGAAALGTAAGGLASAATRDWAQSVASGLTTDPAAQTVVANALSNGVASAAGAAGGLLGGAGKGNASVNALSGAAAASAVQQFNQAEDNAKTGKSDLPAGYTPYGTADDPSQINLIMGPNGVAYRITDRTDAEGHPVYANEATHEAVTFVGGQMTPLPQGWTLQGNGMQDSVVNVTGVHVTGEGTQKPSNLPESVQMPAANNTVVATYGPMNPGPLASDIANTFRSGTYTEMVAQQPTTLYRVYGGTAKQMGGYWTETPPAGPVQSIIDSALLPQWGNPATNVVKIEIPAGTTYFSGVAAPQGGLVGGGSQIVFPANFRVNPSWIKAP